MLYWVLVFFVFALIAGLLGFTKIATGAMDIARVLFLIFVVLFLISLLLHIFGVALPMGVVPLLC